MTDVSTVWGGSFLPQTGSAWVLTDTTAFRVNGTVIPFVAPPPPPPETLEERRARERREQQARDQAIVEARRAAKEQAERRARKLLRKNMTKAQKTEYDENEEFHVTSSLGNRFLIRQGRAHNVFLLDDDDRRVTEFCGYVRDHVPDCDNMLVQKLMLEADEALYRRNANSSSR